MKTLYSIFTLLIISIAAPFSADAADAVTVTAADIIGKIYGISNPEVSEAVWLNEISDKTGLTPEKEDMGLWISSDNGFRLSYEGMTPEVDAMVRFEHGSVGGYGYIFYFPYESFHREKANREQCEFCSALLQELSDMGIALGSDPYTAGLFDVSGIFCGNTLHLSLREDIQSETITADLASGAIPQDRKGEFILTVSVISPSLTAQTLSF